MMGLITFQSGLSGVELELELTRGLDKAIHFLIFGVLGWLMTRGFINAPGTFISKYYMWFVIVIAFFFAVLDELHQSQIPGRYPDAWDWVADTLGILVFMWWYTKRNIPKIQE